MDLTTKKYVHHYLAIEGNYLDYNDIDLATEICFHIIEENQYYGGTEPENVIKKDVIGKVKIVLTKSMLSYNQDDAILHLDCVSASCGIIAKMYYDKDIFSSFHDSLMIIDSISIRDDKQGQGIGASVIRYLEDVFGYGRLVILEAYPLVHEKGNYTGDDFRIVKKRLNRFYKKLNYDILGRVKMGKDYINVYFKELN